MLSTKRHLDVFLSRLHKIRFVKLRTCRPNVVRQTHPSSSASEQGPGRFERLSTSCSQLSSVSNGTRFITASRFGKSSTLRPSSTSTALRLYKLDGAARRIQHLRPHLRHVRSDEPPRALRCQTCRHNLRRLQCARRHIRGVEARQSHHLSMIHSPRLTRHHRARGKRVLRRKAGRRR